MKELIHRDALSAWRHLSVSGGLELDGRDEGLDERMRNRLDASAPSLEQALAATDMASFVRAFFEALHPYVAMFQDILDFFERARATLGESQWTLQVDDIDLSLEHFRKWLAKWDDVAKVAITVPAIDAKAGWRLWYVLQEQPAVQEELEKLFEDKPLNISEDAREWVSSYNRNVLSLFPQSLSGSRCPPALAKSAAIASAVLQRLLDQSLNPKRLKDLYDTHRQAVHSRGDHEILDPSDGFDIWTIAQHETDYWLRSFIVALAAASALPESELAAVGRKLDEITDRFPLRPVQVTASVVDLESLLSMPIWEKRFDLYSVWIATEIVRALEAHDIEIHHDQGQMAFAFKETVIATIHSSPGPFRLISERRTPLTNPKGEHRKAAVQPDHGLWTSQDGKELCKMTIEVKHYKNSSKAKFLAVFEDYARALPDGDIYLVNHGPIGAVVSGVAESLRKRCKAIGHLTSSNMEAREEFASAVRKCVGKPIASWPAAKQLQSSSSVLLIDVSGSMKAALQSPAMHLFVRSLAGNELPAKLVAADEKIVGEWDVSEAGFEELLRFEGASTDLSWPISELLNLYESVLVITDKDGAATIQGFEISPYSEQPEVRGVEMLLCRKR